nr:putative short-chain dehydrogenase/reductase family 42E member 2 [Cavia porcellus]
MDPSGLPRPEFLVWAARPKMSHIKKRLFMFRFGDRRTRMNWVHVRNLVQAHVLAAEALTAAKGYVASGQAYYINDGESVNLFEWMAPLFEKLGYSQPWVQVPTSWVYLTAAVMEHLHVALRPVASVPLLLTRSEGGPNPVPAPLESSQLLGFAQAVSPGSEM